MIAWMATAYAAEVRLDRVDLLAEAPGTWLPYEAPRLATVPEIAALRWLAQVSPVVSVGNAEIGASLSAQTLGFRRPLVGDLSLDGALIARAFLPVGARLGLAWRPGNVRIGVSAVALADATWVRADYRSWTVLPAVGLGIGRDLRPRAPWMDD